jgi:plastocyanin
MKTITALLACLLLLLLAACTSPAAQPPQTTPPAQENPDTSVETGIVNGGIVDIVIKDWMFLPANITVHVGDRVRWDNKMPFIKSIWMWGEAPSPAFKPGTTWSVIFTKPGFYKYRDQYQQDMEGNITVLPAENASDSNVQIAQTPNASA